MRRISSCLVLLLLLVCVAHEASAATVNRQSTATRAPASGRCNCNCALHHNDPLCAVNSRGERDTFVNQCQLECHNCTSRGNYRIVLRKACS